MNKQSIYRVFFLNDDSIYDIYAKNVCESEMYGFLEVEKLVFGENSATIVDPSEERLKVEFQDVVRTYIPLHHVLRIDEVSKEGVAKSTQSKSKVSNISQFPMRPILEREDRH